VGAAVARVNDKAADLELTTDQLDLAISVFKNARNQHREAEHRQESRMLVDAFFDGGRYYLEGDDEELDDEELKFLFSEEHALAAKSEIEFIRGVNAQAAHWDALSDEFRSEIMNEIMKFAVDCGADKQLLESKITDFNFTYLKGSRIESPIRPRGKPSKFPGQWEVTVCLLEFWLNSGKKFRLGRIRYEDGTQTPSPVVRYISKYLKQIDPIFPMGNLLDRSEEECLDRAFRILFYLKQSGKIPART
jgi:hypothetical protein